ncbi:hypothetical protein [Microcoleus sp. FACHB-68]|uniref:hypothetical protein n=1 Tax=Microcoleus sp. FACHB-68 TaxID=2692826 RepID=UPI00168A3181|nr:hypothetical protein [Microcoleus sp. FACHB-68]MBD1939690.1 hypothetical protein [Microcoleus sp. FACHB-68]
MSNLMKEERSAPPTILVLEPDDETRPLLKHNLISKGYRTIVVLDAQDAIDRIRGRSEPPDLLLINQMDLSIEECVNLGLYICQSTDIPKDTPIVIIAEHYGTDLEGQDIQIGEREYVTYLEDGQQLMNLLCRLCCAR